MSFFDTASLGDKIINAVASFVALVLPSGTDGTTKTVPTTTGGSGSHVGLDVQVIGGTVTATVDETTLAKDATLTGGTQKSINRGGAKGATSAADVTSTSMGADHQGLDTAPTQYHATTPTKTDLAAGPEEVSKRGLQFVCASLRCARKLALPAAGAWTGFQSLPEGPCDAVRVDTEGCVVYKQPTERAPIALQTDVSWTAGAGWTIANGTATHANPGGTNALSQDTSSTHAADPLLANEYYAVVFTVAGRANGTITPYLGTTAGTARSTDGTYIEVMQAQSAVLSFVPTNTFDGAITLTSVWAIPGSLPLAANTWEPYSAIKIVGVAAGGTPGTLSTTIKVQAGWYRVAGATEQT